jgi:hypothetical protein
VFRFADRLRSMGTERELRYRVFVVLLDEYVGTLPQMRRRNPKRDPLKPFVYVGLTSLPVNRRFDFRRAAPEHEWRLHKFAVRLMPELYDLLQPMTCKQALQTAKKLADDLRAKGFGVANGVCTEAQSYKSILAQGSTPGASNAFQPQRFSLTSITSSRVTRSSSREGFRRRARRKEKQ